MTGIHDKIREMREADIIVGSLIEITLKEGAEWYNGYTPAPTVNPRGYVAPEEGEGVLTENPGLRGVGYVGEFKDDRVTLAPAWGKDREKSPIGPVYFAGSYFVHGDVIYSFKRLR